MKKLTVLFFLLPLFAMGQGVPYVPNIGGHSTNETILTPTINGPVTNSVTGIVTYWTNGTPAFSAPAGSVAYTTTLGIWTNASAGNNWGQVGGGSGGSATNAIANSYGLGTNTLLVNPTNASTASGAADTFVLASGYPAGTLPINIGGALLGNYIDMIDDVFYNSDDTFRFWGGPPISFNGEWTVAGFGLQTMSYGGFGVAEGDLTIPNLAYFTGPFTGDASRTFRLSLQANSMVQVNFPKPYGPHLFDGVTSIDPVPGGLGSPGNAPPLAGPEIWANMPIAPAIVTFFDFFLYNPTNRSTFQSTNYIGSILTNYFNSGVSAAMTNAGVPMMTILDYYWQQTNRDANGFLSVNPLNGVTNSPVTGPMPSLNWYATNCHAFGELASVALAWSPFMPTNGQYEVDMDYAGNIYYRPATAAPAVSYPITSPHSARFDVMNVISNGCDAVHAAFAPSGEYPGSDDEMIQTIDDAMRIVWELPRRVSIQQLPISNGWSQVNGGLVSMWIQDGNPNPNQCLLSERSALTCNLFICGNGGCNGSNSLDSVHWFLDHFTTNYVAWGVMGPGHLPVYFPQLISSYTTNWYQAAETMSAVCAYPTLLPPCLQNTFPSTTNNTFYKYVTNNEVLAIYAQQKAADWPPRIVARNPWWEIVSRPLDTGAVAVAFLSYTNPAAAPLNLTNFTISLPQAGCNPSLSYVVRDCWNHSTIGTFSGGQTVTISNVPVACGMIYKLTPTNSAIFTAVTWTNWANEGAMIVQSNQYWSLFSSNFLVMTLQDDGSSANGQLAFGGVPNTVGAPVTFFQVHASGDAFDLGDNGDTLYGIGYNTVDNGTMVVNSYSSFNFVPGLSFYYNVTSGRGSGTEIGTFGGGSIFLWETNNAQYWPANPTIADASGGLALVNNQGMPQFLLSGSAAGTTWTSTNTPLLSPNVANNTIGQPFNAGALTNLGTAAGFTFTTLVCFTNTTYNASWGQIANTNYTVPAGHLAFLLWNYTLTNGGAFYITNITRGGPCLFFTNSEEANAVIATNSIIGGTYGDWFNPGDVLGITNNGPAPSGAQLRAAILKQLP